MGGGQLVFSGRDLTAVPARERGFGIVFQSYSLFPNMTVAQNVGYGLRIRGDSKGAVQTRVGDLLALVKMRQLSDRFPWQRPGGPHPYRKRVVWGTSVLVRLDNG